MKVYGIVLSPFVRKVLAICSIKGLEHEHETVIPNNPPPEYLKISPLGKIPALTDGEFSISDSSVICNYLEEKYPAVPTMPEGPEQRARCRWLEEYGDTKLVEALAPFFFERVVKAMLGMGEPDENRLNALLESEVPTRLSYLESQIPESGFLFDNIGIADIALASPLITAQYGRMPFDDEAYPRTAAYLERVKMHPAMSPVLEAERALLSG
jgi:glutathione S-transferase